jgi:epoxyqueuosine reductase
MAGLTTDIKEQALLLGFSKIGIARAGRLEAESKRLDEWLVRGYDAGMKWMAERRDKRIDPRTLLPGAKSVVSVALNYYTPARHAEDPAAGKISRYAWGDDYHDIVKDRLDKLLEFILSQRPEASGKAYVDTGPVMDKAWAQRAGIGWQGKHTNLITEEFGSWVFLGEILLDLELEYDNPALDLCGNCTLCIEACPTDAITEAYVVDSNRCISYLTIEHRGSIAEELGEKFGGWIYGCDICQDVCPWNIRDSRPSNVREFYPRPENVEPELSGVAELSQRAFSARFKKSPIKRAKREGMIRNARIAMAASSKDAP